MAKKTVFNSDWCDEQLYPQWAKWLQPDDKSVSSAKCIACRKTFSLSNMGRQAIVSHENGPKHKKNLKTSNAKQPTLQDLVVVMNTNSAPTTAISNSAQSTAPISAVTTVISEALNDKLLFSLKEEDSRHVASKGKINNYLLNDQVSRAEILWCLRTVMTHSSYRSNTDVAEIFQEMFPDSAIAKKFTMKKDKTLYTISFGLATFFKDEFAVTLSSAENFVVCFDESLNKVVQKGQMDIHVRFWKSDKKAVITRYLTSVFLGHAYAASLLDAFMEAIPKSQINKILQISMDGPNVNHKFHSLFQNELKKVPDSPILVDIGSCGLHIVHGAFKTGHKSTSWELNKFLYALYNLFKDSPARRADYIRLTGSSKFPLKFCSVRWLESSTAAQRALDILPNARLYVTQAKVEKIEPNNKTYSIIKCMLNCNEIIEAKLGFFISVASEVQGFLTRFQANTPIAPFLFEEMHIILGNLMKRFIKNSAISEANTAQKLMNIDVNDKSNLLSTNHIDIGFAAKHSLLKSKASDLSKLKYRNDCLMFLQKMTLKLIERNPLRYKLVRGISCFSPHLLSNSTSLCSKRLETALDVFVECNQIDPLTADKVKAEFSCFVESAAVRNAMAEFNYQDDRLDTLYSSLMDNNVSYSSLYKFVKSILILSHGNATVEKGFSINKALLVENLQEHSVIALRTVYDAVNNAGGLLEVDVSKKMILAVRNAHGYYREELLRKQRICKESKELFFKKKRDAEEVKQMKIKRIKIQQDADHKIAELNGL